MTASVTSPAISRPRLWFGLLGGALAWTIHLIAASIISEWGCLSGVHYREFAGITVVAWALLALSAAMLLVALIATWSAYQVDRHYHDAAGHTRESDHYDVHGTDVFMARTALWSSGIFVFIIVAQIVPILYFLTGC